MPVCTAGLLLGSRRPWFRERRWRWWRWRRRRLAWERRWLRWRHKIHGTRHGDLVLSCDDAGYCIGLGRRWRRRRGRVRRAQRSGISRRHARSDSSRGPLDGSGKLLLSHHRRANGPGGAGCCCGRAATTGQRRGRPYPRQTLPLCQIVGTEVTKQPPFGARTPRMQRAVRHRRQHAHASVWGLRVLGATMTLEPRLCQAGACPWRRATQLREGQHEQPGGIDKWASLCRGGADVLALDQQAQRLAVVHLLDQVQVEVDRAAQSARVAHSARRGDHQKQCTAATFRGL